MNTPKTYYTLLLSILFSFNVMGNANEPLTNKQKQDSAYPRNFNVLVSKGDSLLLNNQPEQALLAFKEALNIAKNDNIDSLLKISNFKLTNTSLKLKKYVDVIYYANEFEYYAGEEISEERAEIKKIISDVYRETGQWGKAREQMETSVEIWEKLEDSVKKKEVNYQYCSTIFYNHTYDEARICYTNFLEGIEEVDTFNITRSKIAIGACYSRLKKYENSILYFLDAAKILDKQNNLRLQGYIHHNLSNDYFRLGKFDKALKEAKKAISIREEEKSFLLGFTYSLTAEILEAMGNELEMNVYLMKATESAVIMKDDRLNRQIHDIKRNNALRKKDYSTAHNELKEIMALDEKKYKEDVEGLMSKEIAKGAVNKKELEISNLKLEKKHEEQQRLSLAFILGLISLLFIGSLYFIHRLRKVNQELETKNKLIEQQKEELKISNKDLEQFAYIASHDLKEPVRTIGSYASLLNRRYKDKLGDSGSEFVGFIKQASIRMNLLLSDLLHYSRLNTHQFEKKDVNMNNVLIIVEENLYEVLKNDNVKLDATELPIISANKIQMVRMFQNLIKNGVVYNKSEEKIIKIWAEEKKDSWTFFVKDNGIGIAPEYQNKVFEIFKRLHSKDKYDGSGIGLSSCQKIVMMHGGKINLKSEVGKGTTFYFTIPKE